jgi:hypothetical protein
MVFLGRLFHGTRGKLRHVCHPNQKQSERRAVPCSGACRDGKLAEAMVRNSVAATQQIADWLKKLGMSEARWARRGSRTGAETLGNASPRRKFQWSSAATPGKEIRLGGRFMQRASVSRASYRLNGLVSWNRQRYGWLPIEDRPASVISCKTWPRLRPGLFSIAAGYPRDCERASQPWRE